MYYNFYDPLPKFNKSANSGKSMNVKHACTNSDTDKVNPDGSNPDGSNPDGPNPDRITFVKKTSVVKNNVKVHANRTQQVWVLKNPN